MFNFMSKKSNRKYPVATRVVKTGRWIHSDQLEVGMYVSELEIAWEDTRFMFQGFVIGDHKQLRDVQAASQWVFVESEKLAKVSADSTNRLCGATHKASKWA